MGDGMSRLSRASFKMVNPGVWPHVSLCRCPQPCLWVGGGLSGAERELRAQATFLLSGATQGFVKGHIPPTTVPLCITDLD